MGNATLRASITAILDYLGVGDTDKLRITLKKAPDEALPKMFYEMSAALSELMEDKTILQTLQIKLPDGKVVSYDEAEKFAKKQNLGTPLKKQEKKEKATFKNTPPTPKRYVDADAPFNYRPPKRSQSKRQR